MIDMLGRYLNNYALLVCVNIGTIPTELSLLTNLEYLGLSWNKLHGMVM